MEPKIRKLPDLPVGVHTPGGHGSLTDKPMLETDPTIGYKLNHSMLAIRDPAATLNFYINLMGMRTIFAMNTGPFTVYYLGYPRTQEQRADPGTFVRETAPPDIMPHTLGLLELVHWHGAEEGEGARKQPGHHVGFGHLGFTVPDVKATVERLRKEGVKIVKDLGESEYVPFLTGEKKEDALKGEQVDGGFRGIVEQIAFVEDPVSHFLLF